MFSQKALGTALGMPGNTKLQFGRFSESAWEHQTSVWQVFCENAWERQLLSWHVFYVLIPLSVPSVFSVRTSSFVF